MDRNTGTAASRHCLGRGHYEANQNLRCRTGGCDRIGQSLRSGAQCAARHNTANRYWAAERGFVLRYHRHRTEAVCIAEQRTHVVHRDRGERRGISTVQDLGRVTPGLIYAEAGNGLPVCSLRGIGFFSTSLGSRPTVSVYMDEAPISPATPPLSHRSETG